MQSEPDHPDRVAVVTGAGTGIGLATSQSLVADGWQVALIGRRRSVLDSAAGSSDRMTAFAADLADPTAVEHLARQLVERFPAIDLLVLNAGSGHPGPTESVSEVAEHWLGTVSRVILPAVLLEHALNPFLRRPGARVVVITSASARGGGPAAYGSAKAALNRWVVTQASLLGAEGITVNAVAPGFVPDTELYDGGVNAEWSAKIVRGIAVGRPGTPQDIADTVCWLARPQSGFVSGTVIEVDGGRKVI